MSEDIWEYDTEIVIKQKTYDRVLGFRKKKYVDGKYTDEDETFDDILNGFMDAIEHEW